MMGNKMAIKAIALEVLENLAGVMPALFKDISVESKGRLLSNLEDFLWATGEWMVAKHFSAESTSLVKHKEIVKDACLSAVISRLGIIEDEAKAKFLQAVSRAMGNVIGAVLKGL